MDRSIVRGSMVCLAIILAASLDNSVFATISISSPMPRQVVQRSASNTATINVSGAFSGITNIYQVQARMVVMPGATNNGVTTAWTVIPLVPNSTTTFNGIITGVAAGGWYQLEVRAVDAAANVLDSMTVDRVGVGDVFVIAGQSNAACAGMPQQIPTDDRVSSGVMVNNAITSWQFGKDPQPENSGGIGTNGSPWPILGSLLAASNNLPVGFVGVAYSGSSVTQWQFGTQNFANLDFALTDLGTNGVRAVLWHQGETDSGNGMSATNYAQLLGSVVTMIRRFTHSSAPWGIAEVSAYQAGATNEEPVAAGHRLFTYGTTNCFFGARTDDFNLENETFDGVHFNALGLADHAQQWANVLLGVEDLMVKNGNFESNPDPALNDPVLGDDAMDGFTRVIGWNRLNGAGTGFADGFAGRMNPGVSSYTGAVDNLSGGVLPNMNGKQIATLQDGTASNSFLQTLPAHLQPSTTYTLQVALGMRDSGSRSFGGYRLDILTNGAPFGLGAIGDSNTVNALAGGNATGQFTVVSYSVTSGVTVPTNQQLAIRLTKVAGANSYLDMDNVRISSQLTPYGKWAMTNFGSVTLPASLPAADPDGDGLPNLIEYHLLGANPLVSTPMSYPFVTQLGGETYRQLQLQKNPAATTGSIGIQMSYDLANWVTATNSGNGDVIVSNDLNQLVVWVPGSATPTAFFRIVALP